MGARFGEILAEARKAKKLTLRKLGNWVGLSPSFLSEVEHCRRKPPEDPKKIKDLALALSLNPKELALAAAKERERRNPKVFERLFEVNEDLAYGLCRAAEEASAQDVEAALEKALEVLKSVRKIG
jgi:transcriptional regulator with XRE-family HTH domain